MGIPLAGWTSGERSRVQCLALPRKRVRTRHLDEVIAAILAGAQASARTLCITGWQWSASGIASPS